MRGVVWQMAVWGQVDGDFALVAQGDKQISVRGVCGAPVRELWGEAGLRRMEPPEGSQEPVARGPADRGVGVVQVPDVDAEEVSKPNDRRRGDSDSPFGDLAEEVS